ncbi:hypothetical protein [Sutcliffiella deserti]|uniref:hypothetical protein n=1 Tax=Sutcliffiella deserti TaxID=2875501 RepID=UPI001CC15AF1|nr:hypothetical protein [Sutcliffiella deserti]
MKKWVFSALIYLLVVVGGYTAYSYFTEGNRASDNHAEHEPQAEEEEDGSGEEHAEHGSSEEHAEHGSDDEHDDHGDHAHESESEVITNVELENEEITITLEDQQGNPMDELEINHERLMHLIVISEDFESYRHLHPEKAEPGKYVVKTDLGDGMYQAFVDIKPSNLEYQIQAHSLMVGEHAEHGDEHVHLEKDSNFTKTLDGYEVTLNAESFSVKDSVVLSFNIEGGTPENYLGALGHVVVVDEKLEQFIHVHPSSKKEPVFEAHFSNPGLYKLWAEFKLDGTVYAFPYVIEITE